MKYTTETEASDWKKVRELTSSFRPGLIDRVKVSSVQESFIRADDVIRKTLHAFSNQGYNIADSDPGHNIGHLVRDYVNARILFYDIEANPKDSFIGFVGGVLHDIGCAVSPRYSESRRAVRHAEMGALFLDGFFRDNSNLNDAERLSIVYAVAAHTNYTREESVQCEDGFVRIIKPYADLDWDDNPVWPVHFTRWVDRLDCNGPTFVGRLYLTLNTKEEDYDGYNHFDVSFSHHMLPLLRPTRDQIDTQTGRRNQTMVEHMLVLADSQTNDSPYGKNDYGLMVSLRDKERSQLHKIIHSTRAGTTFDSARELEIRQAWKSFLGDTIEPSPSGRQAADVLDLKLENLPDEARWAWCNGFLTTMQEYIPYSQERLKMLEETGLEDFSLPGITRDLRKIVSSDGKSWVSAL